ncbi:MAG: DUF2723 domain-containing protein [Bacteriovoracia bacterium]
MKALGAIFFFLCLAAFYFFCLPHHVQGGDTAELVAAAYLKLVAHPPGYPLWIWLQHFWIKIPLGTIFWRASLLSAIFSLTSLAVLALSLRKNPLLLWLCLPLLALSTVFYEAALLPDVFALHGLFVMAIGCAFFFLGPESKSRRLLVPFLLCLGLAHHLTIIFLLPLLAGLAWEERASKTALAEIAAAALAGLALALLSYTSIFLLQTDSPYSWGEIRTFSGIWRHFLRLEYGSLQLSAEGNGVSLLPFLHFLGVNSLNLIPLVAFAGMILRWRPAAKKDFRFLCGSAALLASLAFFLLANVRPAGMGSEVLLRFHLMPVILCVLLAAYILNSTIITAYTYRIFYFIAALALVPFFFVVGDLVKLRKDSVIEDYATNALAEASRVEPAILLVENDHAYFALQYAKSIFGLAPHVAVASPRLFFHPWYLNKIQVTLPTFRLADPRHAWEERTLELEKDLLAPNIAKINFVFTRGFRPQGRYKTTFLSLGYAVSSGHGQEFAPRRDLLLRSRPLSQGPQNYGKKLLFSQYANYFLAQGAADFTVGKKDTALAAWHHALAIVPYAWPALQNICRVTKGEDPACAPEQVEKVYSAALGGLYFMQ